MNIIEQQLAKFDKQFPLDERVGDVWVTQLADELKEFLRQSMVEVIETVLKEAELEQKNLLHADSNQDLALDEEYNRAVKDQKQCHKDIIQSYKQL